MARESTYIGLMTLTIDADLDTALWRTAFESLDAGDDVLVAKGGKTVAKLVPVTQPDVSNPPLHQGVWKGKMWISPDVDDPLDDSTRWMKTSSERRRACRAVVTDRRPPA